MTTFKAHENDALLHEKLKGISTSVYDGMYGSVPTKLTSKNNNCVIEKFEGDNNNSLYAIIIIIIAIILVYFIYKNKQLFFKNY